MMEEFKNKLKSIADKKLSDILQNHKPNGGQSGSLVNTQNALKAFGKMTELSTNMLVEEANNLYPEMGIEKDDALQVIQELQSGYLEKIKKAAGF